LDPNIPRRELTILQRIVDAINEPYKKDKTFTPFVLVYRLPILLDKRDGYEALIFYLYDSQSRITREYTVQYTYTNPEKTEIRVLNGYRTRTVMEDQIFQTGYNIDAYNQNLRQMESYYLPMEPTQSIPLPLNPHLYTYAPNGSNLNTDTARVKLGEPSGQFNASLFSS
jgi:hypothetical protein